MENKKNAGNLKNQDFDRKTLFDYFDQEEYQKVTDYYQKNILEAEKISGKKEILKRVAYSYLKLKKYEEVVFYSEELMMSEFKMTLEEEAHVYLWMTYAYEGLCFLNKEKSTMEEFFENLKKAKENLNNFAEKFEKKFKGEKKLSDNKFYCGYKKDIEFLEKNLPKKEKIQSFDSLSSLEECSDDLIENTENLKKTFGI